MSGDVQPRKRKDKKRKKDELGLEEPRGTAAALGEGDVFLHSHHEHGTGGHWCAKIIFFSLLAVLITLIGLIILENRGLSELEANAVESRYSGVLEGWLEDAPDDDHHDEHTLELKHHDDEDDHSPEIDDQHEDNDEDDEHGEIDDHDEDDDDEDEHGEIDDHDEDDDEDEHGEIDDHDDDDNEDEIDDDKDDEDEIGDSYEERDDKDDKDEIDDEDYGHDAKDHHDEDDNEVDEDDNDDERNYHDSNEDEIDEDDRDGNENLEWDENDTAEADDTQNEEVNDQSVENDAGDKDNSNENENDLDDNETQEDEEDDSDEKEEEDLEVEVERLEKEFSEEDELSEELPIAEDDDKSEEISRELGPEIDSEDAIDGEISEDEEFLEPDDIEEDLPVVEHIAAPKGKPLVEVEEEASTMKPADTLADEEEYEKQQEELKREQEQASHMWLKLVVGGALLVATHAVVRRATAPRDDTPASDEHASREETPVITRRMTLISEDTAAAAVPKQVTQPNVEEQIIERVTSVSQSASHPTPESEEEEEDDDDEVVIETKDMITAEPTKQVETDDKELFSDEEEDEEEEEEIVKEVEKNIPVQTAPQKPEPEVDEDVPDDVEIIDEEQIEEELEEEENEEEEISDVDDAELLSRLEAKYGRLPEIDRPGPKQKDGGNSIEDDWPGEPSDQYWRQQLDQAEEELRQGDWGTASERTMAEQLKGSGRGRWVLARALDAEAEARRDNRLLTRAITAYLDVLKMNDRLTDHRILEVANRTLDRIRFRGNYLSAEPVYRLLIRRFPGVPDFYNNLTVTFLMANRADLAEQVIKETLQKWPNDRIALAHHGFVLKTQHNRLEEAVAAFQKALDGDTGPATESRFYYHLGDALLLLGRYAEAHEVHKRGAALGHFLSPAQRSLYNVDRLKSQPWWNIEQTPYLKLARALEKSWKEILKEGEAAKASYEKEKEGLKERGEWSQLDLFVRGQEIPNRCKRAPVTCSIVRSEPAAAGCRRGQVKFSLMEAGTHVRPHVGPTNCRLRMHLGLSNTKDTYIRVDQETRQWKEGKTLMFDDSFEHEVWHNGTGPRLVLIVDVWHPALTPAERRSLPPI